MLRSPFYLRLHLVVRIAQYTRMTFHQSDRPNFVFIQSHKITVFSLVTSFSLVVSEEHTASIF